MNYSLNGMGTYQITRQTKELKRYAWGSLPALLGFYCIVRFGMYNQIHMYIFMSILYVFFFVFIPINLAHKINKVIIMISFFDSKIEIKTKKSLIMLDNIRIEKSNGSFTGFGKSHTNGFLVKDIDKNKDYWLIDTFFNEIDDIENELNKYM